MNFASISTWILFVNSILLIVFVLRSFVLSLKLSKYKQVEHYIRSIDMDSISTLHDKRYLSEARVLLDEIKS